MPPRNVVAKDLLKQAGVAPPPTYDELRAALPAIKEKTGGFVMAGELVYSVLDALYLSFFDPGLPLNHPLNIR